ncbi:mechanosensitive ion channel protein MscS [bacterium SM23_57]|nr:MAG: mechanosensitive ion channel protein MscS [bacterium SM23_57]
MEYKELFGQALKWIISVGPKILLILILSFVAIQASRLISRKLFATLKKARPEAEMQKRVDTLSSLIGYVMVVVVLGVAAIMILGEFGIKIGPILAAAGIAGLAVGFGAQHLVQDIITGFFILVDDEIRIGDVVQISGKSGLVEKVNLRLTVLRDLSGNVHYIRNGMIDVVTNMTKEYSRYVFEIGVAYREDVDEVISVIKEVDENLRNDPEYGCDIIEPIEVFGLDQFGDSALIIKARTTTKPIKQWRIAREFNRRLKKTFDERNIEIPFPHVTLYMGEDKDGTAPPMHLAMKKE